MIEDALKSFDKIFEKHGLKALLSLGITLLSVYLFHPINVILLFIIEFCLLLPTIDFLDKYLKSFREFSKNFLKKRHRVKDRIEDLYRLIYEERQVLAMIWYSKDKRKDFRCDDQVVQNLASKCFVDIENIHKTFGSLVFQPVKINKNIEKLMKKKKVRDYILKDFAHIR